MIDALSRGPGTDAVRGYAGTMAGFWSGLSSTLRALDTAAADSRRLDEISPETLRALQYRLHWSSERLAGVEPPAGVRDGHAELAAALVDARDVTGDVVEALETWGSEGARPLVLEWRGALFRVRLARMRLTRPEVSVLRPAARPRGAAPAAALALLGVAAFAAGAVLIVWPLWAAGLALVAGSLLVQRP
jgi:hypothetical protein